MDCKLLRDGDYFKFIFVFLISAVIYFGFPLLVGRMDVREPQLFSNNQLLLPFILKAFFLLRFMTHHFCLSVH